MKFAAIGICTFCFFVLSSAVFAQSDLPFPPGTKVSITTPAGECSGALKSSSDGFIAIQEDGRRHLTYVPSSSVGFIRVEEPLGSRNGRANSRRNANDSRNNRANPRNNRSKTRNNKAEPEGNRTNPNGKAAPTIKRRPGAVERLSKSVKSMSRIRSRNQAVSDLVDAFDEEINMSTADDATIDRDQHFIFGEPEITDPDRFRFTPTGSTQEVEGYDVYEKIAYTIGHFEKHKVPAWVAMKWTKENLQSNRFFDRDDFDFDTDDDLPSHAQAPTSLRHATFGFERGHMARNRDLYAFGFDATAEGFLMSNIVPQQQPGHSSWGHLENEHRGIVGARSDIDEIWVVSGPIFENDEPFKVITSQGKTMSAPHATYKVIGWFTGEQFHCRGYIIDQEDDIDRPDLDLAIRSVDEIEVATGIDFFHKLPDDVETALESKSHTRLWDDPTT